MAKLYHKVPEKMTGKILYPLNMLKEIYPEIYKLQAKKYTGREDVQQLKIPFLNCLWNDVLHLTAIHPSKIKEALKQAGFKYPKEKFFEIEASLLDKGKAVIYRFESPAFDSQEDEFEAFEISKLKLYAEVPAATKKYYKEKANKHQKLKLRWMFIPHILYRGKIDVSRAKIITV